ncbi:MAG: NAD(P)/FAD-dependent oxidoreductase, partial [Flavobacteriaceae bacterium]
MNIPRSSYPRVIIIGGGFGGISLAKELSKKEMQVVLLDKHNYHTFQPLLYQVSTGGLEPDSIAYPIRKVLKDFPNFFFRLANVTEVCPETKSVLTDIGELKYDYMVLATGSDTNFFGNAEIEKNAMVMKTIPESLNLRSLILENFEQALLTDEMHERDALMNFVIVGGGPTGVELAGALAEIKKGILPKDYPDLDTRRVQINLVQSSDRILKEMSEKASIKSEEFLEKLGVQIWKNTRVCSYDGKTVSTNVEGLSFEAATMVWAAGVKGALVQGFNDKECIVRGNRLKVDIYNQVMGHEGVYAIGDVACMVTEDCPEGHPMMAQPALQQGKHLGENLVRLVEGKPLKPFVYKDKGSMATVGRNKA